MLINFLIALILGGSVGAALGYSLAPKVIQLNHKQMARWIDTQMKNDFVRGVVPNDDKYEARRLLRAFYASED